MQSREPGLEDRSVVLLLVRGLGEPLAQEDEGGPPSLTIHSHLTGSETGCLVKENNSNFYFLT